MLVWNSEQRDKNKIVGSKDFKRLQHELVNMKTGKFFKQVRP